MPASIRAHPKRYPITLPDMTLGARVSQLPTELRYIQYDSSLELRYLPSIRALISKDLSEPYSIYVYRYFLNQWGDLCFMVCVFIRLPHYKSLRDLTAKFNQTLDASSNLIGVVISKLEPHQSPHSQHSTLRGYIAMLAVSSSYRGHGIATTLVRKAIDEMIARGADEVVLETETSNEAAMKLYERLGFLRSKKLWRYYLNGSTAYRLVLYLKDGVGRGLEEQEDGMDEVERIGQLTSENYEQDMRSTNLAST